jgi:hypothetical protein
MRSSASQEILWDLKVQCHVHNSPPRPRKCVAFCNTLVDCSLLLTQYICSCPALSENRLLHLQLLEISTERNLCFDIALGWLNVVLRKHMNYIKRKRTQIQTLARELDTVRTYNSHHYIVSRRHSGRLLCSKSLGLPENYKTRQLRQYRTNNPSGRNSGQKMFCVGTDRGRPSRTCLSG